MCNGHSPTDISIRSGVTVMQRPWPLAKANGFILKMGYERFYRLHTKREMTTEFVTGNPKQGKTQNAKPTVLILKPTAKGPPAIYVVGRAFLARKQEPRHFGNAVWCGNLDVYFPAP